MQPRLQPKLELVGSEESGKIEIERRGYLTSGEKAFMAQVKSNDEASALLVGLSRRIATHFKIDLMKAYEMVTDAISGKAGDPMIVEIEELFSEDIAKAVTALTTSQGRDKLLQATCLMTYRVDPEWTVVDTMEMHEDLVEGLCQLYLDEENKSIEALDPELKSEQTVEEIEKKPMKK